MPSKRVLVCSVLMELEFAYRIDTVPAQLTVGDRTPTGNPLLDRALERIAASAEIQGHQGVDRDTVRDRRRHDQGRHAGQPDGAGAFWNAASGASWGCSGPSPTARSTARRHSIPDSALRACCSLTRFPTPRDIALICLAEACDILRAVFTADEVPADEAPPRSVAQNGPDRKRDDYPACHLEAGVRRIDPQASLIPPCVGWDTP